MLGYQERLSAFAEGKRLARLSSKVQAPAGALCDACGSTLPRLLFALEDTASGRHYFVGQNCLASLVETGLVARARYRKRAEAAYRREMDLRANGGSGGSPEKVTNERPFPPRSARRTVLVLACDSEYRVGIRLQAGRGAVSAWASEPRWRYMWAREDGGVILHSERISRRAALAVCVLRASAEARRLWQQRCADADEAEIGVTRAC